MQKTILITLFILALSIGVFGQSPSAEKMFYWQKDCAICDQMTSEGKTYYIFNTPNFSLAFAGIEAKKAYYAEVYLFNKSTDPKNRIEFDPNDSRIAVFVKRDDKGVLLISPMSPKEAADKMDGSGSAKVKNFFNRWGANMANRTATANSTTNGTVTVAGADGIRSGTYEGRTTTTVTVPNEEAQSRAEENVARRAAQVEAKQNAVLDTALRANTIKPVA